MVELLRALSTLTETMPLLRRLLGTHPLTVFSLFYSRSHVSLEKRIDLCCSFLSASHLKMSFINRDNQGDLKDFSYLGLGLVASFLSRRLIDSAYNIMSLLCLSLCIIIFSFEFCSL